MARKATDQVTTIGIDIGKNNFHLIGLDGAGNIVLRRKLSRSQVVVRLANLPPCLIAMEACVGAHHLSRQLQARYMSRSDVKVAPSKSGIPRNADVQKGRAQGRLIAEVVEELLGLRFFETMLQCPGRC